MRYTLSSCAVLTALGTLLPAQEESTTLSRLLDRAAVVVHATAVESSDPNPGFHRIVFRTEETLAGTATGTFSLLEPAGRCCGRALHGMAIGSQYLLFLERRGHAFHLLGGSRGALAFRPAAASHVRALAATTSDRDRLLLLADGLANSDPRVRRDAALTLPGMRPLESASVRIRTRIRAAIDDHLQRGDAALACLLQAAVRLRMNDALDSLVPAYLDARRPEMNRLLGTVIPALDGTMAAQAVTRHLPTDGPGQLRAVDLLAELPPSAARPVLLQLASGADRAVSVHASTALLGHGARRVDLAERVPAAVLNLAERQVERRKAYRSVLRRRR